MRRALCVEFLGRARIRTAVSIALVLGTIVLSPSATAAIAVSVPANVDARGRTDVTQQLQRFVDSVPDGSTIRFPRGARYRIDGTLEWRDRRALTLDGNGATLFARAHGGPSRAHIRLIDGGGWKIRNLRITGANREGGRFDPDYQWQHGVDLRGVHGAELERLAISGVFGDDIYVGLSPTGGRWSQGIRIRRSTGVGSGRMAIAVTAGRRVTVDGGTWSSPGLSTFDIEPNGAPGGADRILIERATVGPGSRHRALDVTGRGPVSNITLRDNRFTGRALHVRVDQSSGRPRNIVVEGNVSRVPFKGSGPAMMFRKTDGVIVRGNVQALERGGATALIAAPGSTRVDLARQRTFYRAASSRSPMTHYAVGGGALAAIVLLGHACRTVRRRGRAERHLS